MKADPYTFNPKVLDHLPDHARALLDFEPERLAADLFSAAEYAAARLTDEACGYTRSEAAHAESPPTSRYDGIDPLEAWDLMQMQLVPQTVNTLATEILRRSQERASYRDHESSRRRFASVGD
jgi:hypothetical protein